MTYAGPPVLLCGATYRGGIPGPAPICNRPAGHDGRHSNRHVEWGPAPWDVWSPAADRVAP